MAKAPIAGACKSRLAETTGPNNAAWFAQAALDTLLERSAGLPVRTTILVAAEQDLAWFHEADLSDWLAGVQPTTDLGHRMLHAMVHADTTTVAAVIGSDVPDVPLEHAVTALMDLQREAGPAALLCPTSDGGFWLFGLNAAARDQLAESMDALAQVPWSSGQEYAQTVAKLQDRGIQVTHGPQGHDVDSWEDLKALLQRLEDLSLDRNGRLQGWQRRLLQVCQDLVGNDPVGRLGISSL